MVEIIGIDLSKVPEQLWPTLLNLLSFEEQSRAAEFRFERHRREHVAAHALKRLLLARATGLAPTKLRFTAGEFGKPRISGLEGPHFNISHCEGMVACAVSNDHPVGVDVEPGDRRAPLELAGSLFAEDEQAWLARQPKTEKGVGFFSLWTLKEAFIKALGTGLQQNTKAFSLQFAPLSVKFTDPAFGRPGDWHFLLERTTSGHLVAAAWTGESPAVKLEIVGLQQLM